MPSNVDAHQTRFNLTSSSHVLLAFLVDAVWSQQLQGGSMSMTYPGLSKSCQQALNTSVSCPFALDSLSQKCVYSTALVAFADVLSREGTVITVAPELTITAVGLYWTKKAPRLSASNHAFPL